MSLPKTWPLKRPRRWGYRDVTHLFRANAKQPTCKEHVLQKETLDR